MSAISEPQTRPTSAGSAAWPPAAWARRTTRAADGAHDNFLAFFEVSADHLGRVAVGQAEAEGHPFGFAVGPEDEHVPRHGRLLARTEDIVSRLLRRREDFADAAARHLTDLLGAAAVLELTEPGLPKLGHLLPALLQDRVQLRLLLGGEVQPRHQALPNLGEGRLTATLARVRRAAGPALGRLAASGPEAKRSVRPLQP